MRTNIWPQPNHHAGRVGADRHVDVVAELGKRGYLVHPHTHLLRMNAHAAQHNVLPPRRIGIETDLSVEKRGNAARRDKPPLTGLVNTGEHFKQRGFARSVQPDQSDTVAIHDIDADVAEGADIDPVQGVSRKISMRRGGEQRLFQRSAAALINRKVDADVAQTKERQGS
jgi:hypothetical protein